MKTFFALLLIFHGAAAFGAEATFAWHDGETYRPPDLEGTFPIDPEASKRLEWELSRLEGAGKDTNAFELLRTGLRGLRGRQTAALQWFGNTYIWNQSPQDPQAIELMYHASGSTNSQISYNAIYFGLSTVRPMTQSILRALVQVGMNTEDPNVLSRIAWGTSAQKSDLLRHLQPHLESTNPKQSQHAKELQKIFSGEVKAFAWAEARAQVAATEKYSGRLEEIRASLTSGDSSARRETLDLIQGESITLIMDETFISAFAAAASDPNPKVRKAIASHVGSQWIWKSAARSPEAIDLMMRLSRDMDREVRYNANYYGLSTIRNRSDDVVERMLEMAMQDGLDNKDFRQRITWGFRDDKATVRRVLEKWMQGDEAIKSLFAYGFFLDFLAETPSAHSLAAALLRAPEKVVGHLIAFGPTTGWKPRDLDEFFGKLREELTSAHADLVLWTNNEGPPFVMVEEEQAASIRELMLRSPHFKVAMERPLPAKTVVQMGKEGSLKNVFQ